MNGATDGATAETSYERTLVNSALAADWEVMIDAM